MMRGNNCGVWCSPGFLRVAILFTQTQGGMATIAIGLYLWLAERKADAGADAVKRALAFLAPCVLLVLMVFCYYVLRAGFHTVVYDLVIFPLTGLSGSINSPRMLLHQLPKIHGVASLLQGVPFFVIIGLVPYVYLITLYVLWRERREQRPRVADAPAVCGWGRVGH